jgi:hypothetical protein
MTGRELIEEIKKCGNIDLPINISVDYHPDYPLRRVFTNEFLEIIDNDSNEITLLFSGYSNNDMEKDVL